MHVVCLSLPHVCHAGAEERELVEVDEKHRDSRVDAERANTWHRGGGADDERQHVGQVRDRDGHGRF